MKTTFFIVAVASLPVWAALPESVTLDEAVALAKERQPSLRQARATAEAAMARARQSLAPLLPQVNAAVSYSRSTANFAARPGSVPQSINTTTRVISFQSYDYFAGNITANSTIWDFFQGWNRYQATLSLADAQLAQQHAAEVAAMLEARTAWQTARAQKDLVEVTKAALGNAELHLQQVQGFVTVGTRPAIDLAQSRAERATARLNFVNAKNNYAVSKARLNRAMGVEGPVTYEVTGDDSTELEDEKKDASALMSEAIAARPEAVALDAQVTAQDYLNRSIRGAYLPALGVQAAGTFAAADLAQPAPNLSAQVTLNWALWQGGLTTAQLGEGDAILRQLEAQRDGLRLQIRLDVETAVLGVGAAREAVEVASEAADAAQEQLRLAEGRYTAGAGSVIERGDAQIAVTTAMANVVQAKANVAIARSQLIASLGRP